MRKLNEKLVCAFISFIYKTLSDSCSNLLVGNLKIKITKSATHKSKSFYESNEQRLTECRIWLTRGKITEYQEGQYVPEGQFGDWGGERGASRKEGLLEALETHPFETSQKTDPMKLGIMTCSQPSPNPSVHQTPKKHLWVRGCLTFHFTLNEIIVASVWGKKGMAFRIRTSVC